MKSLTRRAFFRGTRIAVAGGTALAAIAVVGLPALPKRKLIQFKLHSYQIHQLHLIESNHDIAFERWSGLYQGVIPKRGTKL